MAITLNQNSIFYHASNLMVYVASLTCIGFASFLLLGAFVEIPDFYRPLYSGEATHPITAVLIIFVSTQLFLTVTTRWAKFFHLKLTFLTTIFCTTVFIDKLLGIHFIDGLTMYLGIFAYEKSIGLNTQVGINTSILFFMLSIAATLLFYQYRKYALFMALLSLVLPVFSLAGYLIDAKELYDSMSLMTLSFGLVLNLMIAIKSAEPYLIGLSPIRASLFMNLVIVVPLVALSLVVIHQFNDLRLFSLVLLITPWLIVLLSLLSFLAFGMVDLKRNTEIDSE